MMTIREVQEILDKIKNVRIAVYGDFCLDAYWMLNSKGGETSVETGLQTQVVEKHYYSLGGASNVVANIAELKPAAIRAIGVIGDDIFGRELVRQLIAMGVDTGGLIVQKENFDTYVFCKRYLEGKEKRRVDLGCFNKRSRKTDEALIHSLRTGLKSCDVVIFNQQVEGSITNEEFLNQANRLFEEFHDRVVLLDSRHYGMRIHPVYRKLNDIEAARLAGAKAKWDDFVPLPDLIRTSRILFEQSQKPVFITRGSRGILAVDSVGLHEVPGIQLLKKLDTVGAGDTVISALALCLGAGIEPAQAAEFANFAAAVTVQKIFQTGTASGEEILKVAKNVDWIYQPELAEDIRKARYLNESEIELCADARSLEFGRIKHAVFDHDGTLSVLRQGWETVMEPVMAQAILGDRYVNADQALHRKVLERVSEYIEKSTGIQTLLQMEALVEMVGEFGVVPQDQILDKFGYKKNYNRALMIEVDKRIRRLEEGVLKVHDYTIKGSVGFLRALREKGVTLYLASGTDHDDTVREAGMLGYADLFNGGIFGASDDIHKNSKREVIENIIHTNRLWGPELAVFGDGPVEMRECRKVNGIAIGVASDEVRRHGLNQRKRARLIQAGAQVVTPDFSQEDRLLRLLFQK
jgi:rfaE bifunctional protein kinase chain/domain